MTGRYAQGFDALPSGSSTAAIVALLEKEGWFTFNTVSPPSIALETGRFGYGQRLRWHYGELNPTQYFLIKPIGYHCSQGFVSAGLNLAVDNSVPPVLGVFDAVNNAVVACIKLDLYGTVKAYRGSDGGTLLGASVPGVFNQQADIDVEVRFKIDATAGEIEVRINTVSVLSLVSQNTAGTGLAYFDSIVTGSGLSGATTLIADFATDDFRFYDTSGSINNAFLGTCRVQTCLVAGDGATTNFSRSNTGLLNWQNLLNKNVDDTLYLFDPTVGDENLSTIQPLVNSGPVFWVQVNGFYRQDDATQRQVKNRIVSAGVTQDGAAFFTSQTYTCDIDIFELNPATGLTFTGAQVNALQVGTLIYA